MKIVVFSDVHDNLMRWQEAAEIIKAEKIKIGICCGDTGDLQTLEAIAKPFKKLYLCFGNLDYHIKNKTELFPENIELFEKTGEFTLHRVRPYASGGQKQVKIAIVHYDYMAKEMAKERKYDIVFYGHTHTPWEEKIENTVLLNPGEVSGQFGRASFAVYELSKMKASLRLLK